jgi:hypothetical protein
MEEIFGNGGFFAKFSGNYKHRAGQIKMAEAVLRG